MFGLALSVVFIIFGIFLQHTENPGFQKSKRFAKMLILLGIITFIGRLVLFYLENQQH